MDKIHLTSLPPADGHSVPAPLSMGGLIAFRREVTASARQLVTNGVDFSRAPFVVGTAPINPADLAESLTSFFYQMRDRDGPVLSVLWQRCTQFAVGTPELTALRVAGERIAADYDRGIGAGQRNAYHNRDHTFEVLSCAHLLALLQHSLGAPINTEEHLLLLLAALIHNWHHDGGSNGDELFRLEMIAVRAARPYLLDLSPLQQHRLELMVRTTDIASGAHHYARTALAYQRLCGRLSTGEPRPPAPPPPVGMDSLGPLMGEEHARTTELAALLRDADILPASGLTADYAVLYSSRMRDERAQPYTHEDYARFLALVLARPRTKFDERLPMPEEPDGTFFSYASRAGQLFNALLPGVAAGHAQKLFEMGETLEELAAAQAENEPSVDLSLLVQMQGEIEKLGAPEPLRAETVEGLRRGLQQAGFFEAPPFTLVVRNLHNLSIPLPQSAQGDALSRLTLSEYTADTLQRLHTLIGPAVSAITSHLYEEIGLASTTPLTRAALAIAAALDAGEGTGTYEDNPAQERNPYHNHFHILDLLLISGMLGQRASQRGATASAPAARGLLLISALICHWHHNGIGNRIAGGYVPFYLQDRALEFARPHLSILSEEEREAVAVLVRSTDPREAYGFTRSAYAYHIGLSNKPEVPELGQGLARLLSDPALCTLAMRLNDAIFVPFVGLGAHYGARSLVQLGREIGQPLDFGFARRTLIAPLLSRSLYAGEQPPSVLMVAPQRIASFTSAEAQALFNPSLHALLISGGKLTPRAGFITPLQAPIRPPVSAPTSTPVESLPAESGGVASVLPPLPPSPVLPARASFEQTALPPLPVFRYHPDPLKTGAIKPTGLICVCCKQIRGYSYFGPVHETHWDEGRICPWCIADGSAREKLGARFARPQPLLAHNIPLNVITEVCERTPGYPSWQPDVWASHCGDAAAFDGDVSTEEARLAPLPLRAALLRHYDLSETAWSSFIATYQPGGDPAIYRFTCLHCSSRIFHWDCS